MVSPVNPTKAYQRKKDRLRRRMRHARLRLSGPKLGVTVRPTVESDKNPARGRSLKSRIVLPCGASVGP